MANDDYSIFSGIRKLFSKKIKVPQGANGVRVFSKGFDIKLEGDAEKRWLEREVKTFALQPKDYMGMAPIPKLMISEGDTVKAGTPVFFDKKNPDILFVSPVSGKFMELRRGEKRSINELVFLADDEQNAVAHILPSEDRVAYIEFLKKSGGWSLLRQRPYDVIPDSEVTPKNIFITTFDTAPLAPDNNFVVEGEENEFQKGLDVLNVMTDGSVYLGLNAKEKVSSIFSDAKGVVKTYFHGKHPAGNVGVQIHHTAPLGPQDVVWYVDVQDVNTLGRLFLTGEFINERVVAITGAEISETGYVRTRQGANIDELLGQSIGEGKRYISGDVLTGKQKEKTGFLGMFDDQITIVEEDDDYEMFGWLFPGKGRPSVSGTYFRNRMLPSKKYKAGTNTHGDKRAFVVTGQYENLMPMDVHLQHVLKAIISNDFERMEGLGLYELSEEDVALCEFACTSKQPLQQILREGLDIMREQS